MKITRRAYGKHYDNILVGGSGFIGTALIDLLLKKRESIMSISRDPQKHRSHVDTLVLDVDSKKALQENFPHGKNVFILIGQNSDTFNPEQELRNIKNLVRVLNTTMPEKVFYFSSALVYGESEAFAQESDSSEPIDAYSKFKCDAEQVLRTSLDEKITLGILRLSNVYGNPRNRGFINFLMGRLFTIVGERISINGDGTQERDYMFIDDVVAAIIAVRDGITTNDTVNIATGESHSLIQLVETVSRLTGQPLPYERNGKELAEIVKSRISNTTLRNAYGYIPRYSFQDGLYETFRRYRGHQQQIDGSTMLLLGGEGFIGRNVSAYFAMKNPCTSIGNEQSLFPRTQDVFMRADPYHDAIDMDYDVIIQLIDHRVPLSILIEEERQLLQKISSPARTHLILFSSSVVYANPESEYGIRKILLEEFYKTTCAEQGIRLTILRLFNTFGPFQFPYRPGSLVSNLVYNYLNDVTTEIKDIHTKRDFVFSQDISKFVEFVIKNKSEGTFDVGSGVLCSIQELIWVLEKEVLEDTIDITNKEVYEKVVCPPAHIELFESIQLTKLSEGLRQTVSFYRDNMSFVKKYVERK